LRKVQEEGRDQSRKAGHPKEQEARSQWHLPVLWDKGIQDRQSLGSGILPCPAQHTWRSNLVDLLRCVDVGYRPELLYLFESSVHYLVIPDIG
jgi:hypothetical protein